MSKVVFFICFFNCTRFLLFIWKRIIAYTAVFTDSLSWKASKRLRSWENMSIWSLFVFILLLFCNWEALIGEWKLDFQYLWWRKSLKSRIFFIEFWRLTLFNSKITFFLLTFCSSHSDILTFLVDWIPFLHFIHKRN